MLLDAAEIGIWDGMGEGSEGPSRMGHDRSVLTAVGEPGASISICPGRDERI